ncbi:iron-containing redox enzyme family protein [Nocardioides jishulii]|uniref:Iron-containing redox enzyme family protein n=1 Tax=Nocardioides jishulii TaxID=2575440 RepID=A0A4U2YNS8_9ACTN|nr:iron-containing redox enzyme family protein [Nocardioides jishulii]QCX27843.1 iron-containing redox enzyme family protein [Nocardioides jishulii]TKI62650.1 iron-containing redox enzyme family protein [Nocardioides jishulii]
MKTPRPCGPLSTWVSLTLTGGDPGEMPEVTSHDPLLDLDFQLALWTLYELHYSGFDDADDAWEWDPTLLTFRASLEKPFEEALRTLSAPLVPATLSVAPTTSDAMVELLMSMIDGAPSSGLAQHVQRRADLEQFTHFMRLRSIYHLKESDPQTFVVARLPGDVKVAVSELQYDEFGAGRPEMLHQTLFAEALEACGLDATYGAYLPDADASTLAVNNTMSLFALHRRLRGASIGHLAAFEATSSVPCRRIAGGIRRLGLPDAAAAYYDEHVEADAVHEQLALRDICGRAVTLEPALAPDVVFGAAACLAVDHLSGLQLMRAWGLDLDAEGAA